MYSGKFNCSSTINVMNDSYAQLPEMYVFPEKNVKNKLCFSLFT